MCRTLNLTRSFLPSMSAVFVVFAVASYSAIGVRADEAQFSAVEHTRKTIYHSPQKPGFTSWAGAWTMPDGNLMVCFTQATGPVDGRPRAPKEVQRQLSWPPRGRPGTT